MFVNWPGLAKPWLFLDDYHKIHFVSTVVKSDVALGRPVEGLWFSTFYLDGNLEQPENNMALRFIHGSIHVLASTFAAILIWKHTKRWIALFSMIPFLIWPFNGEAVLWRAAAGYPIAAFLSILGVYLISLEGRFRFVWKTLGMIFISASLLANQLSAFAGLVLLLIIIGLDFEENINISRKKLGRYLYVIFGYFLGGTISILLLRFYSPDLQRSHFATDLYVKIKLLYRLNRQFISSPDFYPDWIIGLHVVLLVSAMCWLIWNVYKNNGIRINMLISILIFASLFAIPYTALLLLTTESWSSWRLMYLAPFLFTMALNLFNLGSENVLIVRRLPILILIILIVGYFQIGRINSSEYVTVFDGDIRVLRQFELAANQQGANQVTVSTYPDFISDWNPYDIKYSHGSSKHSAFHIQYSWYTFINNFSTLKRWVGRRKKNVQLFASAKLKQLPF